ncbi:MAG: nitrite reductase, copper-containing [Aequorivita sp.]|nr:nitrite reductase, copper-containing [Aequorivita sp.]
MKLILKKNIVPRILLVLGTAIFLSGCVNDQSKKKYNDTVDIPVNQEMTAELTSPPYVPTPIGKRMAKKLIVDMEIQERKGQLSDGVSYMYWTFGGTVPGSFIRTRVGDEIEFHLKNHPQNKLAHNIDLHAVNGPGGGAVSSLVAPGHETVFSFKVLNPGLYVYHCATAPVGMHIANGMYGLILVEPEGGLEPVDKEFYVMQGDFYTKGNYGDPGLQPFDMQKAINEDPDYVVFNGHVGSMVGDNALQVKVGETIRLFVGNAGPSLVSSFHIIGEIMDKVHVEGGSLVNKNVQTTLIPAGGATIIELKINAPGEYLMVDHSIFRAFNKGALAVIDAKGEKNDKVYKGKIQEGIYQPEGGAIQEMPLSNNEKEKSSEQAEILTKEQKIELGKNIFGSTCIACHQASGQGVPGAFPPLAKSDFLNADANRAIDIVMRGKTGEITVNGKKYNSVMTAQTLSNKDIANVLTYVYNSWGNNGTEVTEEMVKKVREKK